jgi:hypothetical protein|tara:strand:+ start:133 stop:375 length:243 start_codon:yes stop_codon:yes gene_type:complete
MSKEYNVHIRSTVSYEFTVEVDADSEEEAMQIADDNYWQDDYHGEQRASQMHDEFEVVSATEIVQEDDSMDDDDDFPGRE